MIGSPAGQSWGEDTGARVGSDEIRIFRGHDRLFKMYETGPGGYGQIREIWRDGLHVAFELEADARLAADRIGFAGGYLLDNCPFCGTYHGVHLSDWEQEGVFVQCDTCSAGGPCVGFETSGYNQKAADLWNARTVARADRIFDFKKGVDSSNKHAIGVFKLEPDGRVTLLRQIDKPGPG